MGGASSKRGHLFHSTEFGPQDDIYLRFQINKNIGETVTLKM